MPESFGARLRQQREDRQIDLIAISEQTKIKLALLESLERDDVTHWPSGIFRRAYIRAYAQFIGLDPDVVAREFLEVHPDPGDGLIATAAAAAAAEEQYTKTAPSMRFRNIVGSALGSLTRRRPPAAEARPCGEAPAADAAIVPASEPVFEESAATLVDLDLGGGEAAPVVTSEPVVPPAPQAVPVLETAAVARKEEERSNEAPPAVRTMETVVTAPVETAQDTMIENVARLSTELGRVVERNAVRELLQETATTLQAAGLIVWLWDDIAGALRPGLVHGYSDKILAQLPPVRLDADNATADAFRTETTCEVAGTVHNTGALVVPLLIPDGCAGVLAIELQHGVKLTRSLRAFAVLLAAALTQLVHRSRPLDRPQPLERMAPAVGQFRPAARPMKVRRS